MSHKEIQGYFKSKNTFASFLRDLSKAADIACQLEKKADATSKK